MYILGIHGSLTFPSEEAIAIGWPFDIFHDASAVLIKDGTVIAGVAQERLDRIKHSNAFPVDAIHFCLETAGISLSDVSYIAYPNNEQVMDDFLVDQHRQLIRGKALPLGVEGQRCRDIVRALMARGFGVEVPEERIIFVNHHLAHATVAVAGSGFDEALIYVRDGWGDDLSGIVATYEQGVITQLGSSPPTSSLGHFYLTGTQVLGYHLGDEYKMMGLAPYGDPERYRPLVERNIKSQNERPVFDLKGMWQDLANALGGVRSRSAPFEDKHRDIAATFQKVLEDLAFSELRHWRELTGQRKLCCSGGVAQNSSLNGKILKSGLFEQIFVPAAPDDGGLALGAALDVHNKMETDAGKRRRARVRHVFWGTELVAGDALEERLNPWRNLLSVERVSDLPARAARAIANGEVIGWARGRSEFGPRALGSRSILADPRPPQNRTRINQIVKQRESFRPFAPAVTEEAVGEIFKVDHHNGELAFMNFVVSVQERYRSVLGAITHIDGSARVQTVSRSENPVFWELITEFAKLSGVPVVLNTSFNNNAEPIVETVDDVISCFLTTDLDSLVLGEYWIGKVTPTNAICDVLIPRLSIDCALEASEDSCGGGRRYFLRSKRIYSRRTEIDADTYYDLAHPSTEPSVRRSSTECLLDLWRKRLIRMEPSS